MALSSATSKSYQVFTIFGTETSNWLHIFMTLIEYYSFLSELRKDKDFHICISK